jgi:hypothetical protein
MRNLRLPARAGLCAIVVVSLAACTGGNGLPLPSTAPPGQAPSAPAWVDMGAWPDLALPPPVPPDLALPDLAPPPQTIRFTISSVTGSGISGDTTLMSFPLPTPTTIPIDGIEYVYENLHPGQYDFTLEWQDTSDNNRGWTASFGGAPGVTPNWPLTTRRITMTGSATSFGPDKVAFIAGTGAQPNALIFTIRSVSNPQTDYGILVQKVKGN